LEVDFEIGMRLRKGEREFEGYVVGGEMVVPETF